MRITCSFLLTRLITALVIFVGVPNAAFGQSINQYDRDAGRLMLKMIRLDIEKYYYDPTYRGINLQQRFQQADERIKKANSNGEIFGIIAQVLLDFDDSHLLFIPPARVSTVEYGWQMSAIGDKPYVIAVKPGSDANAKGLKPGDQILSIDGFTPTRDVLWKMQYYYYTLRPRPGVKLIVQKPAGETRQLEVLAKVRQGKKQIDFMSPSASEIPWLEAEAENEARLNRNRFHEKDDVIIWKMPGFDIEDEGELGRIMDRVKKHKALILDLRGNGGGLVVMLKRLVGYFVEQDTKVADVKYRKEMKPEMAKSKGANGFKGRVVVLIDSQSGSAAEAFARVMQLEKRGAVIGDRSSGKVMQSRMHTHEVGMETVTFYGVSITNADLIMSDGKSLEHTGVVPDELLLPSPADLAAQRDPVLARAAALVNLNLDSQAAGKLFPIEWRK